MRKKIIEFSITIIILILFFVIRYVIPNKYILNEKYSPKYELNNNDNATANDLQDKIYFFNTGDSDFILISSNGHYGLVDVSNRYSNRITDSNGIEYDTSIDGLSSQTYFTNGKDVAKYMVYALGVDHLDFVIGTHSHSDHIGAIEEICQLKLNNGDYLVDSRTNYFYKTYYHMVSPNDDLDEIGNIISSSNTWHNQAFIYNAKKAMQDRGAKLINVSNGVKISGNNQTTFPDISDIQNENSHLSNATYNANSLNNYYDDYIEFQFGNFKIRLYNLFTNSNSSNDENVNSILTLITKANSSILLTGDINVQDNTEALLAKEIYNYVGHVDLYKMAHHTGLGSNSKEVFDLLQPKYCVATKKSAKYNMAEKVYFFLRYYASRNYNTNFYDTCSADKAIVVTVEEDSFSFKELYDITNNADNPNTYNPNIRTINPRTLDMQNDNYLGWNRWTSYGYSNWLYLEKDSNNQYNVKTGWYKIGEYWYFADEDGIIKHGWQSINGNWYYFAYETEVLETSTTYYPDGAMVRGWKYLKWNNVSYWFYLAQNDSDIKKENTEIYYPEGACVTGWQQIKVRDTIYWFYFARNKNDIEEFPTTGAMVKGRQYVDYLGNKDYYYFAKSTDEFSEYVEGAMIKNKTVDGYTYNGSGICTNNDYVKPTITANNITYGEGLVIRLQDDHSGVTAWQINTSSSEPTSDWIPISNTTDTTVTKAGLSAGTYYIWAKDAERNVASKQITVSKKQIAVEWENTNTFIYNGNNQGPALINSQINGVNNEIVNLEVKGYKQEIGTNYTATAIISSVTGGQASNYSLTGNTKTFSIIGKDINNLTASLSETTYVYDGTAKEPTEEVKDGETRLTKGTDYTVQYIDNINAGTGKAVITGIGIYRGTKNLEFIINKKTIEIPTYIDKTYNTKEQSIVAQEGYNLEGTTKATNVSTNTVTAKLIDTANTQWNDSTTNNKAVTWKIVGYNLSNCIIATVGAKEYTGSAITPEPKVTVPIPSNSNATTIVKGTDFIYSYSNNIAKGDATITITGKGNYTGTKEIKFQIVAKLVKVTSSDFNGVYDGENHGITLNVTEPTSEVTVYYKEGTTELTSDNYETGSTTKPTKKDVGTYTIQWYAHSLNSNYSDVSGSNIITIGKKQIEVDWNEEASFTYNGNNQGPTLKNTQINGVNNEKINLEVQGLKKDVGENYTATAIISDVAGGQANKNNYELIGNTKLFSIIKNNDVMLGELNDNNIIDIGDIILIRRHIAQLNNSNISLKNPTWNLSTDKQLKADVNKNGKIDIGDIVKIQRYIAASNNETVRIKHPNWLLLE